MMISAEASLAGAHGVQLDRLGVASFTGQDQQPENGPVILNAEHI